MAKVLGPLHSSEARGRVGGLVYNSWRGEAYAKAKHAPSQPRTQLQLQIRAWTVYLSRAWQSLSSAEMDSWNTYATLHLITDWTGNSKRLTGANWYIACNLRLLLFGFSVVDTAPTVPAPAPIEDVVATPGAGQISFAFAAAPGTNLTLDVWAYGAHSPGRQGDIRKARRIGEGPAQTTPLVITGLPAGLYTCYLRVVSEDTGLASTWISLQTTVT